MAIAGVITKWKRGSRALLSASLLIGLALSTECVGQQGGDALPAPSLAPLFAHLADVTLGKSVSRLDYQSFDPAAGRLYIAGMGAGKLLVFDARSQQLIAELDGFPRATGVLAVPAIGKLYVSVPGGGLKSAWSVAMGWLRLSSGDGRVAILELASLQETARLHGGVFPDGIAYDPAEKRIFVSDEFGEAIQVIDADADRLLGRIDLGGEAGNVQYDPMSQRVYTPVQTKDQLAVIDPREARVVARFPLPGGRHPHGLAISPWAAVGYVACDADDVLLVVDLPGQSVIATLPLGRDPDVLALDPGLKRLYVASESGDLAVFDIAEPTAPKALGMIKIGPNAHSVAVDPISHKLYLPLADLDGVSILRIIEPRE